MHDFADQDRLLGLAVQGDRGALSELLKRHGPKIRQKLHGQIPAEWQSLLSVDDVLQQTYADAFYAITRFQPRGIDAFVAWLWKMARRNLLDGLKMLRAEKRGGGRRRLHSVSNDDSCLHLYEILAQDSATPSRQVARKEAIRELMNVIESLPDAYRQVVKLYDLQGLSAAEVAQDLDRSAGAVYMLRERAHSRIREEMGAASDFLSGGA